MATCTATLKEGFLVKKRLSKHRWKTRWFVLDEDHLTYYQKTKRQTSLGSIPLAGSAVSYPVPGYDKKPGIFKISTYGGKEVLLRAATNEDRQVWTHAIGAVIRAREGIVATELSQAAKDIAGKTNISEILGAMQDRSAGISTISTSRGKVTYENCFSGAMVIDWLLEWSFASDRGNACSIAGDLLRLAHLQVVKGPMREEQLKTQAPTFIDSAHVLYRFSRRCQSFITYMESSSESSGSSAGELSDGDILDRQVSNISKGKLIKEGFLIKQGHVRKKWKARRVILKENPPSLTYYSMAKSAAEPLKVLSLEDASIPELTSLPNQALPKKREHVFAVRRGDKRLLLFQAENEHEKNDWIKAMELVCPKST